MDDDLLGLAAVFWRQEALAAGVSRHRLDRLASTGVLTRLGRGVFARQATWADAPPWDQQTALSLAAARGVRGSSATHLSGAALFGLPMPWALHPHAHVTALDDVRSGAEPDWFTIHRGALPQRHLVEWLTPHGPITVTTAPRTVLDAMRVTREHDALAMADAALRRGLVDPRDLWAVRREQVHWRGMVVAAQALTLIDPRRENWFESASASLLHRCGIPLGVPQVDVFDRWGTWLARVDSYWPEWGVAGEADGRGKYLDDLDGEGTETGAVQRRVLAAATREARLRETGVAVVRWEPAEIVHDAESVARRWWEAATRPGAGTVTAVLRCSCCRRLLSECEFDRSAPVLRPFQAVKPALRPAWGRGGVSGRG